MEKASDRYTQFEGKTVLIRGSDQHVGKVKAADLSNGVFVLEGVVSFNPYTAKVERRDGVIVPFDGGKVINEVPPSYPESIAADFERRTRLVGQHVLVDGKDYGNLQGFGWDSVVLGPLLVECPPGVYQWTDGPVSLPYNLGTGKMIPIRKEDLDALVADSARKRQIVQLTDQLRLRELEARVSSYNEDLRIETLGRQLKLRAIEQELAKHGDGAEGTKP